MSSSDAERRNVAQGGGGDPQHGGLHPITDDRIVQRRTEAESRRSVRRAKGISMADKPVVADQIDLMFRAFCDRTRLRILSLLSDGELCVGDLVAVLQVPQPKVSRHLAQLRRAGLVITRRTGLWVHYSLAPAKTDFHRKLLECAITCFREVPEIKADTRRVKAIRNAGGCCP
jgi:ArsR family transcriptional regulator